MINNKDKNLQMFKELRDKNFTYFFVDNLQNKSFPIIKYNQKKSFYDLYFEQIRNNYPMKILQVTAVSYIGGCLFGLLMLAFQSFGALHTFTTLQDEKKVYYNSFKHFTGEMRKLVFNSAHRNGMFVIRLTLSIGAFNALINYIPFPHPKFTELYGFGNLDVLFYLIFPSLLFFKSPQLLTVKKLKIFFVTSILYSTFRLLYIDDSYYRLTNKLKQFSKIRSV